MRNLITFRLLLTIFLILIASSLTALDWPVWPDSTTHLVSAGYGMRTSETFLHNGIDILVPPHTTDVFAMESGYVKAIMTTGSISGWRILIADSLGTEECEGWMYAHLRAGYFYHSVGDWVEEGELIGEIADWDDASILEHLHLSRIRFQGDSTEWANNFWTGWEYIANPLDFFDNPNINDTTPPFFANAWGEQSFAFCTNQTDLYFPEGGPISGEVDIVAEIYDYHDFYTWKDGPYMVEYKVDGDSSLPWITSVIFDGEQGSYQTTVNYMTIMYQDDDYCNSIYLGQQNYQKYYFNVTNTDNDGLVEQSDTLESWDTRYFHNGDYLISVKASDHSGNSTTESMTVTVENYYQLSGNVTITDGPNGNAGAIITVLPDGSADTTDSGGNYLIPAVGGGTQTVTIGCMGCDSNEETVTMNQDHVIDGSINFIYVCGDTNGNGVVNILDVTYLVSYMYKGGPAPEHWQTGDVNHNQVINILDITYLISFLYRDGPDLDCP